MQAPAQQPTVALVTGAADGIGLALVEQLLANPSTGRVFASTRNVARAERLSELVFTHSRLQLIEMDINNAAQLEVAAQAMQAAGRLDLVINTAGVLHDDDGLQPERSLADVRASNLIRAFESNALSTLMLAQALEPLLRASSHAVFASLSARVASIGDNRLGGWYAYRASKAALNMLIKTLSIEWSRFSPKITCVALHPGTVRTALSEPFVARRDDDGVFSPTRAADHLLEVVGSLQPTQTGNLYAWDGQRIPW